VSFLQLSGHGQPICSPLLRLRFATFGGFFGSSPFDGVRGLRIVILHPPGRFSIETRLRSPSGLSRHRRKSMLPPLRSQHQREVPSTHSPTLGRGAAAGTAALLPGAVPRGTLIVLDSPEAAPCSQRPSHALAFPRRWTGRVVTPECSAGGCRLRAFRGTPRDPGPAPVQNVRHGWRCIFLAELCCVAFPWVVQGESSDLAGIGVGRFPGVRCLTAAELDGLEG
jgi:hypothetical protein